MRPVVSRREILRPVRAAGPLCVDLDGTLIRTDVLHESVLQLLKANPWGLIRAIWVLLFHGIAAFKQAVSSRAALRPELLPYNHEVLAYVKEEAARGRRLLLTTAADSRVADAVARHLGIFEAVLASDGSLNLKADAKAIQIRRYLGEEPFEYIGNSLSDVAIWREASGAIVVNGTPRIERALRRAGVAITKEFKTGGAFLAAARAMRIYQWSKNVLVFAPLLLSHTIDDRAKLVSTLEAFAAFCAAASAIYVTNDLLDLDADRQHPRKRHRPLAAGTLTIAQGAVLALGLIGLCALISMRLPLATRLLMALYVTTSLVYGVYAKIHLFLDVVTLAGLYTLRLLVGGAAAEIAISPWTLAFSIFFFTSLASCKRLSELRAGRPDGDMALPGRAYFQPDLLSLTALASSSGYAAVVVMALYLNSPDVAKLYRRPQLLWCLLPMVSYWISRTIMVANRGSMHDDPIVFAFGDRASLVVGAGAAAVILASL
jgi:4-hydroxybenzoate polyprenyltransferase/phosphoserine phosphatase